MLAGEPSPGSAAENSAPKAGCRSIETPIPSSKLTLSFQITQSPLAIPVSAAYPPRPPERLDNLHKMDKLCSETTVLRAVAANPSKFR